MKESGLCFEIRLHVVIVVEVVVAQVSEASDVEDDRVDAVSGERLSTDLDGDRADTVFPHPCEKGVQIGALRGRESTHHAEIANVAFSGRAQTGDDAHLPEDRLQKVNRRGLPVRTGDAK